MSIWVLLAIAGLITYLIRLSFIATEGRIKPPQAFRAMLPFVPIAALTALIVPEVLIIGGEFHVLNNARLQAAIIAVAVAWRWRNPTLTIVAGFAALAMLN
jgi:branched-subunit amino acid transport protein